MVSCAACGKEIYVGHDCYQVAKGVLGTRDFINLEHWMYCCFDCLESGTGKVEDDDGEAKKQVRQMRRRIP